MRLCCCPCTALLNLAGGGGRFCHAEQLQNWTLAREIILVGSQQEQIPRAGFLQLQTHNDTKLVPELCCGCPVAVCERCPPIPPAPPVFQPEPWSQRAEQRQACMNTKTKPPRSGFRPEHFESILSIRTLKLSDFYSDYLYLQAAVRKLVLSSAGI